MRCILIRTYADLTFLFLSEVYDLFQSCVISSVFICFPPEVISRSRVFGACPVTADCIVAMSSCENNNNKQLEQPKGGTSSSDCRGRLNAGNLGFVERELKILTYMEGVLGSGIQ